VTTLLLLPRARKRVGPRNGYRQQDLSTESLALDNIELCLEPPPS
jgi:hypothetical protein